MSTARVDLNSVTTVGLDLAKHVFRIHAVGTDGRIVITTALRRKNVLAFFGALPPCVIGLEACGSAHHWARELVKLGHDARRMLCWRQLMATELALPPSVTRSIA
jgi:transposase